MKKTNLERAFVTLLRCTVGWHFLYEGLSKVMADQWSAAGYLANAHGPFAAFFQWMSSSEGILAVVDPLNMYGLVLIGLGLFVGLAINYAAVAGIVLLALYYFAYPPFGGSLTGPVEGSLYIVNKNVIEALGLVALLCIKEKGYGLHAFNFFPARGTVAKAGQDEPGPNSRREALKNLTTLPFLGGLALGAYREQKKYGYDGLSGATMKIGRVEISELKGELPKGKIGKHEISRLVLGGNLIGGFAHSRDLIYVASLFRAYNTEQKIFETLMLAEKVGIDTINIGFSSNDILKKYKDITGSKLKVISQVDHDKKTGDLFVNINKAIDYGVDILQVHGGCCDKMVRDGKVDAIGEMIDKIRSQGYVAGLAAHTVDSLIACEEQGIIPDYYMKTMHHDQYWSAHPVENRVPYEVDGPSSDDHNKYHNNMFCLFPERTIEFVARAKVPVMGYKVLAAGAIKPEDGFNWAYKNGADFICVGMLDYQLVKNVNTTLKTLDKLKGRTREWYG